MVMKAYEGLGPAKVENAVTLTHAHSPFFFLEQNYRMRTAKMLPVTGGEIRTVTPKKVKESVLKHFGNTSLTIRIFR